MPKQRTGGIKQLENGTFQVRVSYVGDDGKRHERLKKNIVTKSEARRILKGFIDDLDDRGQKAVVGDKLTFALLAATYEQQHVFEAQYSNDRKIAGLRSIAPIRTYLKVLRSHFAHVLVREITKVDIQNYKRKRLGTITVRGTPRSISAVNRELALLRQILNFAVENRWLKDNPFQRTRLISSADEVSRNRILSFEEERRLLSACTESRGHLRPIVVTALDTGCRLGEILKLQWKDIDFQNELITIVAFNSKTAEAREIAMTPRVKESLLEVRRAAYTKPALCVFGIQKSIKRAWGTACRLAGIDDLRFHDLRHTAVTRLVATGLPSAEVMRISGHKQANTFLRYVNPKADSLRRAASLLSSYNDSMDAQVEYPSDSVQ